MGKWVRVSDDLTEEVFEEFWRELMLYLYRVARMNYLYPPE